MVMFTSDLKQSDFFQIESEKLFPHEALDIRKFEKLKGNIFSNVDLVNNPLVYKRSEDKYIILDGHHRVECLKQKGANTVICELVNKKEIAFSYWNHVVYDRTFFDYLNHNLDVYVSKLNKKHWLFQIIYNETRYYVYSNSQLDIKKSHLLTNNLINYYLLSGKYHKTSCNQINSEKDELIVIFKKVNLDQILEGDVGLCPSGSTRFKRILLKDDIRLR